MNQKTGKTVAISLGALGLLLIFSGPAFHFIDTKLGIFLALACWIVAPIIRCVSKNKKGGEKDSEEKDQEDKEIKENQEDKEE